MMRNALHAARDLVARGFAVIPIPTQSKKPSIPGWQNLRISTEDDLAKYFADPESNVGVLLGEPSNWIVDVDLDHPLAVQLAHKHLPPTDCTWGRAGKHRSHWLYRLTEPASTRKFTLATKAMIVELRSTGCQTVAPGSLHPSGEPIEWANQGHPTEIEPATLIAACSALAEAVRERCGEKPTPRNDKSPDQRHVAESAGETPYALAALKDECREVASSQEGGRNNRLSIAAFKLGTLIGAGELDRRHAAEALSDAARQCRLPTREAQATIRSGLAAGEKLPRVREQPVSDPYKLSSRKQVSMNQALTMQSSSNRQVPLDGSDAEGFSEIGEETEADRYPVIRADQLCEENPQLRPVIVAGLLRCGEIMNIIAPAKRGKTWLVHSLAMSAISGRPWLGADVQQGRVLLLDAELHNETLAYRIRRAQDAYSLSTEDLKHLDVMPLRGKCCDTKILRRRIESVESGTYRLVIVDALYRFLPEGSEENSNADMTAIYNDLDAMANAQLCAAVVIHHSSKGSQSDKAVTDVGSGAGSQSRAADSHLVLREHEEPGCVVIDAAVRSFKPIEPFGIRWNHERLQWELDDSLDPSALAKAGSKRNTDDPARPEMSPETFAFQCVGPEPKNKTAIETSARLLGLSRDESRRTLILCIERKIVSETKGPNNSILYFQGDQLSF